MIEPEAFRPSERIGICGARIASYLDGKPVNFIGRLSLRLPDGQPYVQPSAEDMEVFEVTCGQEGCETIIPLREVEGRLQIDNASISHAEGSDALEVIDHPVIFG